MEQQIKLDLGCGNRKVAGFIGIDRKADSDADIIRDVEKRGLPFSDSSVAEIVTRHFLEHVTDLIFVMSEIWRVLKPNARVHIEVPVVPCKDAYTDPTHKRFFTDETFKFFEHGSRWCERTRSDGFIGGFRILSQRVESNGALKIDLEAVKED